MTTRARTALLGVRVSVVAFGLAALWLSREGLNADGVAYLDASDEFLAGRWPWSGSGYWSPVYPTLLALGRLVGGTAPERALAVTQVVNFGVFLLTFAAFEWLLGAIRADARARSGFAGSVIRSAVSGEAKGVEPNDVAWHVLAYALFAWMTVGWIRVWLLTPDMCVAGIVCAVAALSLRLRSGRGGWGSAVALGALLGVGYLTKAAMLPVGLVVLTVLAFVLRRRRGVALASVAAIVFVAISVPQIAYVSRLKGSPTFSDVGRMQYLWFVAGVPGMATVALPLPTRLPDPDGPPQTLAALAASDPHPVVYDLDEPIPGTLPIWYDPGHWYRRVVAPIRAMAVARSIVRHVRVYLEVFALLLVGGVGAALAVSGSWQAVRAMRPDPVLVVPALAALAMYSVVLVQTRYIAPFTLLLVLGLVPPWARDPLSRRVRVGLAAGALAGLIFVPHQVRIDAGAWRGSAGARASLVSALRARGVGPGTRLAFIGEPYEALWAYQAGVRFVSMVPRAEAGSFWALDQSGRERVIEQLRAGGASAVIAETPPLGVKTDGWDSLPPAGHPWPSLVVHSDPR